MPQQSDDELLAKLGIKPIVVNRETTARGVIDATGKMVGGPVGISMRALAALNPDTAVNALPAVGGFTGGMVGLPLGWGAVGTAAIGGATGEGLKQGINALRGEPPASLMDIPKEAVIQGAAQAAGLGIAKVASRAAPWLMNRALNLTERLMREFPDITGTTIENAITVTKGGYEKAKAFIIAAKGKANASLNQAHAAGATVPVSAATKGLDKTLAEVLAGADINGGLKTLAKIEKEITAGRGAALNPMEADALKRDLQGRAKTLYAARVAGKGKPKLSVAEQAYADMAKALNTEIDTVTTAAGAPGYRAANMEAQEFIGAERGVARGTRTGSNLLQAMVRPGIGMAIGGTVGYRQQGLMGGLAGSVAGAAITSPAGMSRIAVALTNPGVQAALREAPRLAQALATVTSSPSKTSAISVPPVGTPPVASKTVRFKDLVHMASVLGTTVAEQERLAKAEGFRVVSQ
jgi:hypothetical protein